MISYAKNFIFVHIPKTGGNSVQDSLFRYSEDIRTVDHSVQDGVERFGVSHPGTELTKHSRISEYEMALPKEFFASAFKFAILRNPWDRMVSFYFYVLERKSRQTGQLPQIDPPVDQEAFLELVRRTGGYRGFICGRTDDGGRPRSIDQHKMDFFLRFEHLQDDYEVVCSRLGLEATQLARRNVSRHLPYKSYYNEILYQAVAKRFAAEIEYFDFKF